MHEDIKKNLHIFGGQHIEKPAPVNENSTSDVADLLRKTQDATVEGVVPNLDDSPETLIKKLTEMSEQDVSADPKENKKYFGASGDNVYYIGLETDQPEGADMSVKKAIVYDAADEVVKEAENTENLPVAVFIDMIVRSMNLDSVSYALLMDLGLIKKEEPKPEEPAEEKPADEKPEDKPAEETPAEEKPAGEQEPPAGAQPDEEQPQESVKESSPGTLGEGTAYPPAVDPAKVGQYPALTKSGGGYVYDDVLEYRVWGGTASGDDGFTPFATYEEAKKFQKEHPESEKDIIVLVLQNEYIDEPETGKFELKKGPRITEWNPAWLANSKRTPELVKKIMAGEGK